MANCFSVTAPTAAELAEALAARLITKAEAMLLAGSVPSDFKSPNDAIAYRAAYAKLPSNSYGLCVLRSALSAANPSASCGEFEESAYGIQAAVARMEELKAEGLAIYLIQYRRGAARIKKPVAIWYSEHYKGKRLTA